MKRLLLLSIALLAAACQAPSPQVPQAPSATLPAVPEGIATLAPTPRPAPVPGLTLGPGDTLTFKMTRGDLATLLVVNPSAAESVFGYMVEPRAGEAPAWPTGPGPAVPGEDEDDDEADAPARPPFGFGFSAANRERVPLTSRRRTLAAGPLATGTAATFWINNGDATLAGDRQREARLRLTTPHAYFFVDEGGASTIDQAALERLADAFERDIRPSLTQAFGEEAGPGIDGDPRLYVVFSPWVGQAEGRKGMMGYFWPRDPVPVGGTGGDLRQHANEREVIFLSPDLLAMPDVTAFGTLAHEYQHLLMFAAKSHIDGFPRTEETWLDEGFSMVAMDLAGYGLMGGDHFVAEEIAAFQAAPNLYSLTDWNNNPNGYSYGVSYLFVRYMLDRFGLGLIRDVQQTPETGIPGLEKVLAKQGLTFTQVFVDWALANRPNPTGERAIAGYSWFDPTGEFGEVQLPGTQVMRLESPGSVKVRPWGLAFLECQADESRARSLTLLNPSNPVRVLGGPTREAGP